MHWSMASSGNSEEHRVSAADGGLGDSMTGALVGVSMIGTGGPLLPGNKSSLAL